MTRAAELHRLLITHLCDSLSDSGDRRVVCLDPPDAIADFRRELGNVTGAACWDVIEQGSGSLGERMRQWFQQELARPDCSAAVLIGSDCPLLSPTEIGRAIDALRTHQVVLGPATDGGYVLLGLRGPWISGENGFDRLFSEIPWSTEAVLQTTLDRLRETRIPFAQLPEFSDIDTRADLDHLLESKGERELPQLFAAIQQLLAEPSADGSME